jgi:hypothetical protein
MIIIPGVLVVVDLGFVVVEFVGKDVVWLVTAVVVIVVAFVAVVVALVIASAVVTCAVVSKQ